jgi:uncharacterized protein with PIN domain
MIVDSSAIIAVLLDEADGDDCYAAMRDVASSAITGAC